MIKAILITIAITAPASALVSSYFQYRLQYNLWDWLKDKTLALLGRFKLFEQARVASLKRRALALRDEAVYISAKALTEEKKLAEAIRRRV